MIISEEEKKTFKAEIVSKQKYLLNSAQGFTVLLKNRPKIFNR